MGEKYAIETGYVIANYKEYPPEEIKGYVGPDGFVESKIGDANIFPDEEGAQETRIARWGGNSRFRVEMRQRRVKLPPVCPEPPPEPDYLEVVRMAKEAVRALRSP